MSFPILWSSGTKGMYVLPVLVQPGVAYFTRDSDFVSSHALTTGKAVRRVFQYVFLLFCVLRHTTLVAIATAVLFVS